MSPPWAWPTCGALDRLRRFSNSPFVMAGPSLPPRTLKSWCRSASSLWVAGNIWDWCHEPRPAPCSARSRCWQLVARGCASQLRVLVARLTVYAKNRCLLDEPHTRQLVLLGVSSRATRPVRAIKCLLAGHMRMRRGLGCALGARRCLVAAGICRAVAHATVLLADIVHGRRPQVIVVARCGSCAPARSAHVRPGVPLWLCVESGRRVSLSAHRQLCPSQVGTPAAHAAPPASAVACVTAVVVHRPFVTCSRRAVFCGAVACDPRQAGVSRYSSARARPQAP